MTSNVPPRRQESRSSGARTGRIKLGMFKSIECEVTDLSGNGAKLETEEVSSLPEEFNISIQGSGKRRKYKCVKRWQDGNTVGVEFLTE